MIIFRLIVMFCIDMFYFEKVDIWQTIESDVIIFWSWKSTKCPKKIEKNCTGAIFHTVQTVLYRNETDRQNFLHSNSEHPILLKNSIPYSQILRVKRTCSTIENFKLYCSELYWERAQISPSRSTNINS